MHTRNEDGWIPLHTASGYGHVEVILFLIDHNSDVNSHDNKGRTPLHFAARNGHLGVVKLLLERDTDFSIRNDHDMTGLDLALNNADQGTYGAPCRRVPLQTPTPAGKECHEMRRQAYYNPFTD